MRNLFAMSVLATFLLYTGLSRSGDEPPEKHERSAANETWQRAPEGIPKISAADPRAADVPSGFRVEIVTQGLSYPTSVEFDDDGHLFIAEGGFIYGDDIALARILAMKNGQFETVADQLNGPVTDLLWHKGRLYISHRGKVSVLHNGEVHDLVTGLPSQGDHHNNQLAVGPDGKLYFGQGTATNSGVVGIDNIKMGWVARHPDVHDVPAKDIRITDQAFEAPDLLTLLATDGGARSAQHTDTAHHGASAHKDHDDGKNGTSHSNHSKGKHSSSPNTDTRGKHSVQSTPDKKTSDKVDHATAHKSDEHSHQHRKPPGHEHSITPEQTSVKTFGFQPFGKTPPDDGAIWGTTKANGTILRMNFDGSNLEVYAWGLRNPFGLIWGPDDQLYVSDNGYDERGSRPIAHAPDCVWKIREGAWYGFPDYAAGIPVTDARFRPEHGPAPKFLMRDHPLVEKPLTELEHHVGAAKLAISRSSAFGFQGQLFLALSGDMNPITGEHEERSGFEVMRIDCESGQTASFFKAKKETLGPKGMEYVATAGPRRPVDVQFSHDGKSLYVVDVGAMAIVPTAAGPVPRPFPRTGVVWRITRAGDSHR